MLHRSRQRAGRRRQEVALSNITLASEIVGLSFHDGVDVLDCLSVGDTVTLKRDPTNKHDSNAVEVHVKSATLSFQPLGVNQASYKLGFIKRDDARLIAPHLDAGETIDCVLTAKPEEDRRIVVRLSGKCLANLPGAIVGIKGPAKAPKRVKGDRIRVWL
jgi:hypothetical protein